MASQDDYIKLITSEHRDKPKFMAIVSGLAQGLADTLNLAQSISSAYDLDVAVGKQLDAIGEWVGVTRNIDTPLLGVYFAFDVDGVGFDQGIWKQTFDPVEGITSLDDDTYRTLLKARIAVNYWDGTMDGAASILSGIFGDQVFIYVRDNQNMSMEMGLAGAVVDKIYEQLFTGGYLSLKPGAVRIDYFIVTSVDGPLFGFDMDNEYVSGFDTGAWGLMYAGTSGPSFGFDMDNDQVGGFDHGTWNAN